MLYLNVPYSEKEEAKALGARWNPRVKKWYANVQPRDYVKFSKWLLGENDISILAINHIYIIEGKHECWKCKRPTTVIGLGIGESVHLHNGQYESEDPTEFIEIGSEVHLSWVEQENEIPPKLLHYLKEHYQVKTGFSNTLRRNCFANFCENCGALQGNNFLFYEFSVLLPDSEGAELKKDMSKLRILQIPIKDALQLNWEMGLSSNDYGYLKYGKVEKLILSNNSEDERISYEELYSI